MKEHSYPLAVLYGYRSKRSEIRFIGRRGLITLSGKMGVIEKILRLCNGMTSFREIVNQSPWANAEEILDLLSLCEAQGVVRDSRELYLGFHEDSANPAMFSHDLGATDVATIMAAPRLRARNGRIVRLPQPDKSELLNVIRRRRSTRQFQANRISENKLSGLLEATYGRGRNGRWSVPSGGALYPLDIYLVIPDCNQVLSRGIHRWNPEKHEITLISEADPNVWLVKVVNAKAIVEHAACILCIAANLKRAAMKYANRGYRNTLLEAGHAAQNAYLYCAEQNIGVVEYVGFSEKALAREIGLEFPNEAVITTLIIGTAERHRKRPGVTDQEMVETAWQLRHKLVGESKPIRKIVVWEPEVNGYTMPRWITMATYSPSHYQTNRVMRKRRSAFATGCTLSEAVIKCVAEGFERYAWEQYRSDRIERAVNFNEPFLDPRILTPYTPAQRHFLKDIEPFNPQKETEWVAGVRETSGERIWIPAELVFSPPHPLRNYRKLCYHASSSGVAAHFDKQVAINVALYELIERDAFSVMWYAKRRVHSIPRRYFLNELQVRMSRWEDFGYKVTILDITLDGPPVILVLIWSRGKLPALVSGAACRLSFLEAASRAFDEAEFMAVTWHRRRLKRNMSMCDIKSPDDHGLFYADPKNLVHAEWLLKAEENEAGGKDFSGDLRHFDPIVVDITPDEEYGCGLTVVRVLSEKLMPINFGYGSEHYGHPRMKALQLPWSMRYPSIPHFFA